MVGVFNISTLLVYIIEITFSVKQKKQSLHLEQIMFSPRYERRLKKYMIIEYQARLNKKFEYARLEVPTVNLHATSKMPIWESVAKIPRSLYTTYNNNNNK